MWKKEVEGVHARECHLNKAESRSTPERGVAEWAMNLRDRKEDILGNMIENEQRGC